MPFISLDTTGKAGAQNRDLDDPRSFGANDFPYDGHDYVDNDKFSGVLTPKMIGWGDEVDPVDDEDLGIEEAMGTPINFAQSDGHRTSSIPGGSQGWSSDPAKPWDDEDELENFVEWLEAAEPKEHDLQAFFAPDRDVPSSSKKLDLLSMIGDEETGSRFITADELIALADEDSST